MHSQNSPDSSDHEVDLGCFTVIHPGVSFGRGVRVGSFCEIGSPDGTALHIGDGALIRSYSNIQGGSSFGPGLEVGQYTMLRSGISAGQNFRVGAYSEFAGDTHISDFVRTQSGVHIGRGSTIGDFVWLFNNVLTVTDPLPPSNVHLPASFGALSAVAANSLLMPGVSVGEGAFVGAASVVRADVPDGVFVAGDPAVQLTTVDRMVSVEHGLVHPWPQHFTRGLPPEAVDRARRLADELVARLRSERKGRQR